MSAPSKPSEHPKGSWEDTIIEDSSDLEDSWADDVMFDGSHSSGKEMKNFVKIIFRKKFVNMISRNWYHQLKIKFLNSCIFR